MIKTLLGAVAFSVAFAAPAFAERAVLRGLDKVTGHARDIPVTVGGAPVRFGSLEVVARSCNKRPAEETPEVAIYVEVYDTPPARDGQQRARAEIFHGWLFASSPGLNAIEHPVYDLWAIDCRS